MSRPSGRDSQKAIIGDVTAESRIVRDLRV